MKQIRIITPENVEVEYTLGGVMSRTCAAAIDIIIILFLSALIWISVLLIFLNKDEIWNEYFGWIIGTALVLEFLISFGYYIFMDMSKNGQSIGKRILGLRTIRKNGQPITLKHSAIRNVIGIFIDLYGVGLVTMFANKNCRRLGDFVASTIVILEKEGKRPMELELLQMSNYFLKHLSIEEKELLCTYYQRKNDVGNDELAKDRLIQHFSKKFDKIGMLQGIQEDLKRI